MKKLLALIILLCVAASVPAYAEGFELSKELTGFTNELTGETVYLGMSPAEVEAIAGIAYQTGDLGGIYRRWAIYEGGLMVFYRHNEQMPAVAMTVVPMMIDDEEIFFYEAMEEAYDADENYGLRPYNRYAEHRDSGENISEGMLREEVEAITGAPIRETYIDYEYAYGDTYDEKISYATTDKVLDWQDDRLVTIEVPGITKVDYEDISVGYRAVEHEGETVYVVADSDFTDCGRWYRPAAGFTMGDSGEELLALLGEYAVIHEQEDARVVSAYVHLAEDGAKLVSRDEFSALLKAAGPVMETGDGLHEDLLCINWRVSEDGEISKIDLMEGQFTFYMG